jgi:hypothetical protein
MFGPVAEDKSDFRIVAKSPVAGLPPAGLRITKLVRGKDESMYTFLMPGVVPDPLKLSIHPTGEIQLKTRGVGLITRLNRDELVAGLKSGSLDAALAKFLAPNLEQDGAEGFVLLPDIIPTAIVQPGKPLEDHNLAVGEFFERMTKIQIDDSRELGRAIAVLRQDGLLPPKSAILLATDDSDSPIVFLSLLDAPLSAAPAKLPEGLPMPKTMQALLDSLRLYGGILFTMPDESDLREMARVVGLGDLFDGLARFAAALDQPEVETKVREAMESITEGLAGPMRAVARARPLRPLHPPAPTEAIPSARGWVRRRPRRRGHTAPL